MPGTWIAWPHLPGIFGFPFDREEAARLIENPERGGDEPLRVKLSLYRSGNFTITSGEIFPEKSPLVIGVSPVRIDPDNRLLYHKTSSREMCDTERRKRPECGEVLFVNSRGELSEGSYNNIVLKIDGKLLTPPLASGLLPGVLRGELIDNGDYQSNRFSIRRIFLRRKRSGWSIHCAAAAGQFWLKEKRFEICCSFVVISRSTSCICCRCRRGMVRSCRFCC